MDTRFSLLLLMIIPTNLVAADIDIPIEKRSKNWGNDVGYCWWTSAETVGHFLGIEPLKRISHSVHQDGSEKHGARGAFPGAVRYWEGKLQLKALHNQYGSTEKGIEWVRQRIKQDKLPVIFCVSDWPELRPLPKNFEDGRLYVERMKQRGLNVSDYHFNHSMLLVGISDDEENWSGVMDRSISYIDPNEPQKTWRRPLSWLMRVWLEGRAVAFVP